ncbi:hypothetical protein MRB53_015602 [Persea americana]|uniref:Uncharacterized protein n=1 Tax=Persea americana TaxID=3435 RepID=A0ACC2M0B6_PERAE|nr:hypothetical protein MRB53_015602 [Persea americana]
MIDMVQAQSLQRLSSPESQKRWPQLPALHFQFDSPPPSEAPLPILRAPMQIITSSRPSSSSSSLSSSS